MKMLRRSSPAAFRILLFAALWPLLFSACGTGSALRPPTGAVPVEIIRESGSFRLTRGGKPYEIRGVGGFHDLERAAASGANSVRTWTSEGTDWVLREARSHGMTVMLGFWLSHDPEDYADEVYRRSARGKVRRLVKRHRDDPSLLMWALGNEIDLEADNAEAWMFVDELAGIVKELDPSHPVLSVVSGHDARTLDNVERYASRLDLLGINAYASIKGVGAAVEAAGYDGPYVITEWGPDGYWEVERTPWGRPIEQTSSEKAAAYADRARFIRGLGPRCLGSYVFFWDQKQERTPTWFSMFLEDLPRIGLDEESCPTVDEMQAAWSGEYPGNRAPAVTGLTIDGRDARSAVRLPAKATFRASVYASDPDGDPLEVVWEILREPTELGKGGSWEPRPGRMAVRSTSETSLEWSAPPKPGEYRLFAYVLDGEGHAGTANLPFLVE